MIEIEDLNKKICLIDGDYFPFVVLHCKKLVDNDGNPMLDDDGNNLKETKSLQDSFNEVDEILYNILFHCQSNKFIIAFSKSLDGLTYRHSIDAEYKANRKDRVLPEGYGEVKNYIIDKYKAIYRAGYEADDILVTLKNTLKSNYEPIICSHDGDLLNLEGKNFNIKKFEFVEFNQTQALHKFCKDLCIGQPGDNIKGIKGFGKESWEKLINNYYDEFNQKDLITCVFEEYVKKYGIEEGLISMLKNYKLLKILDNLAIDNPEELIQKL